MKATFLHILIKNTHFQVFFERQGQTCPNYIFAINKCQKTPFFLQPFNLSFNLKIGLYSLY